MDYPGNFKTQSYEDFIHQLSTKSAVPGGGGASALTGAIGAALAGMVLNLTIGKKKFIPIEGKLRSILSRATDAEADMLELINDDAVAFLPLSKAYGLKSDTDEERDIKKDVMKAALIGATEVPLNIMRKAYAGLLIHEDLIQNCSKLAVSDVGVGVQCLRASLTGGYLNVAINLKSIHDTDYVRRVSGEAESLLNNGITLADDIYNKTLEIIEKTK